MKNCKILICTLTKFKFMQVRKIQNISRIFPKQILTILTCNGASTVGRSRWRSPSSPWSCPCRWRRGTLSSVCNRCCTCTGKDDRRKDDIDKTWSPHLCIIQLKFSKAKLLSLGLCYCPLDFGDCIPRCYDFDFYWENGEPKTRFGAKLNAMNH